MSAQLSLAERELHAAMSTQRAVDAVLATVAEDESPETPPLAADEPRVSHVGALRAGIGGTTTPTLSCGPRSIVETRGILWVGDSA